MSDQSRKFMDEKDVLVKPLPISATIEGAESPSASIPKLKSSAALPNHMRRIKNEIRPMQM